MPTRRRLGNTHATQIEYGDRNVLVSYSTPVAVKFQNGQRLVKTSQYFSKTTSRHVNKWVDENGGNAETLPHAEIVKLAGLNW